MEYIHPLVALPQILLFVIAVPIILLIIWPVLSIVAGAKEKANTGNSSPSLIAASTWIGLLFGIPLILFIINMSKNSLVSPTSAAPRLEAPKLTGPKLSVFPTPSILPKSSILPKLSGVSTAPRVSKLRALSKVSNFPSVSALRKPSIKKSVGHSSINPAVNPLRVIGRIKPRR